MRWQSLGLVVLVVASVALPTVAGDATGPSPSVDISIGSTVIDDGDTYEFGENVDITVDASVSEDAADGTELSEIVLRVNGELAESISVDGTTVSETVSPELDDGDNDIRVIVTDDAGDVTSTAFTVTKDDEAPHVYLTSPYETAPWKPITDGNVSGSRVTLSGNVLDDTEVAKLRVTRVFDGDRSTHVFRDGVGNFSVPLVLGYEANTSQTNEIRIVASDEFDNVRIYEFEIGVRDGATPNVSVAPHPEETSRNRIFISGTVEDDVGIERANITLRGPDGNVTGHGQISPPGASPLDPDNQRLSFNESAYLLYLGTYEATISVTDVSGKTTTRTVSIERVERQERDLSPRIAVDRDRTVVLDDETLFLSGVAFEGVTERLAVETRDATTGETLDYQVLHSGSRRERVEFDREVAIAPGRTEVIVRATGARGTEVSERFFVNGSSQETFAGETDEGDGPEWPAVTVSQLQDGRAGTESATVTVERAAGGTTVTAPPTDGRVVGTTNVTVERLSVSLAAASNFTATVVAREAAGDPLSGPDGATSAASVTVQHSLAADHVDGVAFDLAVRRAYLNDRGIDPANLSVYRLSGEQWTALETERAGSNDTHVRYRVDSPGLSVFSLSTAPGDGGDGTAGGDDPQTGTDGGNGPPSNGSESSTGGQAEIFVRDVTVNRTAVAVNETVAVNATLANSGTADGTYVAGFQTVEGVNVSFVGKESVSVPAGESRTVGFTTQFERTGNHTVMVNGTQAGPVVVESGGGGLLSFLSVLSFLPLRLIGMAVGGIVGLLLVVVLLRFVLRRIGGSGESSSG